MTHCHQLCSARTPKKKCSENPPALRKLRANATLRNNSRACGALASFRLSLLTQREAQNCAAPASSPPPFRFICVHFSFELFEYEQLGVACFASLSREHASHSVRAHSTHARVTLILEWGYARSAQARATVYYKSRTERTGEKGSGERGNAPQARMRSSEKKKRKRQGAPQARPA